MNYAKFEAVEKAAKAFAKETENGTRNQAEKAHEMLAEWVKKNCKEKKSNSCYVVRIINYNFGTKKYSDCRKQVEVIKYNPKNIKETEKSFIIYSDYSATSWIISKDSIIGFLSK